MSELDRFRSKQQPLSATQQASVEPATSTRVKAKRGEKCYATLGCAWIEALHGATHRETFKFAIHLMQVYFFTKCTAIKLTNVSLREWRIRRESKAEAIAELERLGLIRVERGGDRRSPVVHLLHTEELPRL